LDKNSKDNPKRRNPATDSKKSVDKKTKRKTMHNPPKTTQKISPAAPRQ